MPNAIKKLKQEEKKVVLAYAQLKLKAIVRERNLKQRISRLLIMIYSTSSVLN